MFEVTVLEGPLEIEEQPCPITPEPHELERVEAAWRAENSGRETPLTNGLIFSLARRNNRRFWGWFVPYKWWIAQQRDPGLYEALRVRPMASSGLTTVREGVLFGKRSAKMTQDPGAWELVPSGGIDTSARRGKCSIDPHAAILAELLEELNLEAQAVRSVSTFALVEEQDCRVFDIALALDLKLGFDEVEREFSGRANDEYTELTLVAPGELKAFVEREGAALAPISVALLQARGLLAPKG